VNNPEKTAFLAYADERVVGQLILNRHWNAFTWVEGIGVDKNYRRLGIGRALVKRGAEWAKKRGLLGIMVETQDNNVKACRFYESCGFILKGFDTGLYQASKQYRDEIALFWYLLV
jgi:GNAT superfamily N-acetyltransferase